MLNTKDFWHREAIRSLKLGTGVSLLLLAVGTVTAYQFDLPWLNDLLRPGFEVAASLIRGKPTAPLWIAVVMILGCCLNIVFYSAAILGIRHVLQLRQLAPVPQPDSVTHERITSGITSDARQAAKFGFVIALGFLLFGLLLRDKAPEWPFAVGDRLYKGAFGNPSHGAGGIYVVSVFLLNALLYSGVIFAGKLIFRASTQRRLKH